VADVTRAAASGTSRRTVLTALAVYPAAAASRTALAFAQTDPKADPAPLLAFVAANEGGVAILDVRLPLNPSITGVRGVVLRDSAAFALLDLRGWRGRGLMIPLGDGIRQDGLAILAGRFQISGTQSFKGPTFSAIEGLPWLFAGSYLAPFG
jgi:hypothetical protein